MKITLRYLILNYLVYLKKESLLFVIFNMLLQCGEVKHNGMLITKCVRHISYQFRISFQLFAYCSNFDFDCTYGQRGND